MGRALLVVIVLVSQLLLPVRGLKAEPCFYSHAGSTGCGQARISGEEDKVKELDLEGCPGDKNDLWVDLTVTSGGTASVEVLWLPPDNVSPRDWNGSWMDPTPKQFQLEEGATIKIALNIKWHMLKVGEMSKGRLIFAMTWVIAGKKVTKNLIYKTTMTIPGPKIKAEDVVVKSVCSDGAISKFGIPVENFGCGMKGQIVFGECKFLEKSHIFPVDIAQREEGKGKSVTMVAIDGLAVRMRDRKVMLPVFIRDLSRTPVIDVPLCSVTLLSNMPPLLEGSQTFSVVRGTKTAFGVACSDEENDPVEFSVLGAPPWCTIEKKGKQSALIMFEPPKDAQTGKVAFKLCCKDSCNTVCVDASLEVKAYETGQYGVVINSGVLLAIGRDDIKSFSVEIKPKAVCKGKDVVFEIFPKETEYFQAEIVSHGDYASLKIKTKNIPYCGIIKISVTVGDRREDAFASLVIY